MVLLDDMQEAIALLGKGGWLRLDSDEHGITVVSWCKRGQAVWEHLSPSPDEALRAMKFIQCTRFAHT